MSEIKQNITNELSEEELENVAGGFGRPTMDDPRYREQMRINNMLKRGMNMEEIQKALKSYSYITISILPGSLRAAPVFLWSPYHFHD